MMRATRWSVWTTAPYMRGHIPPAMVVMRAQDMTTPPEEVADTPGVLVINDTWEMPDGELEAAIAQAIIRSGERERIEGDMATLYHWIVATWQVVKARGMVITGRPAPLSRDDIVTVLSQLCEHPQYDNYQIHVVSGVDGASVRTHEGRVVIDNHPGGD